MKGKGPCPPDKSDAKPTPPPSKAGRMPAGLPAEVRESHGKGQMPHETRKSYKK